MNLSEKIRQCTSGCVANPYQGEDKRVLFVCSMGILRSATGSRIYGHKYNTRCAGTHKEALIPITDDLMAWADEIVFVNPENHAVVEMEKHLDDKKVKILKIPDEYEHMHPEIIKAYNEQYEPVDPVFMKESMTDTASFWVRSSGNRHVWYNTNTGYYTFEDETNNFNGEFHRYEDALKALKEYFVYIG